MNRTSRRNQRIPEPAADVPEGPVAEAKEAFEAYVDLLKDVDIAAIAEVSGEDPRTSK